VEASANPDPQPSAIVYRNGCELFLPVYDQAFVQRLKRLIPPKVRVFHQIPVARYTIAGPDARRAIALAGEWFADFEACYTDAIYEFPGSDRLLTLCRRKAVRR
jgi:hypothetical protein